MFITEGKVVQEADKYAVCRGEAERESKAVALQVDPHSYCPHPYDHVDTDWKNKTAFTCSKNGLRCLISPEMTFQCLSRLSSEKGSLGSHIVMR